MPSEIPVSISEAKMVLSKVFKKAGVPHEEMEVLVDNLIDDELRCVESHGIARAKPYYNRIVKGVIKVPTKMERIADSRSVSSFDGHDGLGQWIAYKGMEEAINKAVLYGIGAVSVRNSQHFGTAGYYAATAADRDMIGLAFTNASPRMAPWGGIDKSFGINPLAIGIPTKDPETPFVLDFSNSIISAGRIRAALQNGEKIPTDWALNEKGELTADPAEALNGILLPMGRHKGYGMAFAFSILCSLLSGGLFDTDVSPVDDVTRPQGISHFFIAINIDFFQPIDAFKERMEELVDAVHCSRREPHVDRIYYPGERSYSKKRESIQSGIINLSRQTWDEVNALLTDRID